MLLGLNEESRSRIVREYLEGSPEARQKFAASMNQPILMRLFYMSPAKKALLPAEEPSEGILEKKSDFTLDTTRFETISRCSENFQKEALKELDGAFFKALYERTSPPGPQLASWDELPKLKGGTLFLNVRDYSDLRKYGRDILDPVCGVELLRTGFVAELFGSKVITSRFVEVGTMYHLPEGAGSVWIDYKVSWKADTTYEGILRYKIELFADASVRAWTPPPISPR